MIIQCSLHYTIMCASSSFNALGIRPRVAPPIFSETRSALAWSILNEPRACYRCHKTARQSMGVCVPFKGAKRRYRHGGRVRLGWIRMRRSTDLEPHPGHPSVTLGARYGVCVRAETALGRMWGHQDGLEW